MIIDKKSYAHEAYVDGGDIYTKDGEQLYFLQDCNGIYTKVTDFNYKKYPRSKKVYFRHGTECSTTFDNEEEWQEWVKFLHDEVHDFEY